MTRLTDLIIIAQLFNTGMIQQSLTLDAMIQSGIAFVDPEVSGFLNGPQGGKTFTKRFLEAISEDESNLSSDVTGENSTPESLTGGSETLVRHSRNKSWGSMDLTAALYGSDPLGAVQTQLAKYWMTQRQMIMMKSIVGIIADNVANDAGDMVEDITAAGDGKFSGTGFVNACLTLGDRMGSINAIGIHSMVMGTLLENEQIDYIPDSEGKQTIPTYKGRRVIMDDGLPVDPNAGTPIYTSALFGGGCIAVGNGAPKVPVEVERNASAGNGGGEEVIHSRVELACHPVGFECTLGLNATTGKSPSWAQLIDAANWNRVYTNRKRIPMAFIQSLA